MTTLEVAKNYPERDLFYFVFIIFAILLTLETFVYSGLVWNTLRSVIPIMHSISHQGMHWLLLVTGTVLIVGIGLAIALHKKTFSMLESFTLGILSIFLLATSLSFFIIESNQFENYIFSTLHIHPSVFFGLAIFSWICWIISVMNLDKKSNKRAQVLLYLFPLTSYLPITGLRLYSPSLFEIVGNEDHVIEWLSAVSLLIITGVCFYFFNKQTSKEVVQKTLLLLLGLVALFVAGEEISWGQRLFGLTTPESLAQVNIQNEISFHNIHFVQDSMFYAYLLLGLIGSFGWIIKDKIKEWLPELFKPVANFIPSFRFSVYNYPLLLYSIMRIITGPINFKTWEEYAELLFFGGFAVFVWCMLSQLNSQKLRR